MANSCFLFHSWSKWSAIRSGSISTYYFSTGQDKKEDGICVQDRECLRCGLRQVKKVEIK